MLLGKTRRMKSTRKKNQESVFRTVNLKKIAYTDLILLNDIRNSSGKVVFSIIKECNVRIMQLENILAWEKLKKKLNPVFAPLW